MNNSHINLRNLGIAVLSPLCMVCVQDFISAIAQLLYNSNRDTGIPVSLLSYTVVILLAAYLYFAHRWIFAVLSDRDCSSISREKKNHTEKNFSVFLRGSVIFIIILAAGISLQFFSTGILNIIDLYNPELLSTYKSMVRSSFSLDNGALRVFTVTILAPVGEELVFRGISLRSFQRAFTFRYSNAAAIFASALLFGLFHGNTVQFCYALPSGILLALITVWSSSLLPAVFLHMTINISSYVADMSKLANLSPAVSIASTAVSGLTCALCFTLLYKFYTKYLDM